MFNVSFGDCVIRDRSRNDSLNCSVRDLLLQFKVQHY